MYILQSLYIFDKVKNNSYPKLITKSCSINIFNHKIIFSQRFFLFLKYIESFIQCVSCSSNKLWEALNSVGSPQCQWEGLLVTLTLWWWNSDITPQWSLLLTLYQPRFWQETKIHRQTYHGESYKETLWRCWQNYGKPIRWRTEGQQKWEALPS